MFIPFLIVLASLILLAVLYVAWGAYKVAVIDKKYYARYWRNRAADLVEPNTIYLVALGDSTFQSLGATKPETGTVGLVASYIHQKTGRPVHVNNLSVSGAKAADVAEKQLWQADFKRADIVMVAVGANDVFKKTQVHSFEESVKKIIASVPQEKTVLADVALVKNRQAYQSVLEAARAGSKVLTANLKDGFKNADKNKSQTAKDFFHPNDYGYSLWFAGFRPQIDTLIKRRNLAK